MKNIWKIYWSLKVIKITILKLITAIEILHTKTKQLNLKIHRVGTVHKELIAGEILKIMVEYDYMV